MEEAILDKGQASGTVSTKLVQIDPRKLRLRELNARYMTHEQFQLLVANVRRDGCLSSVPFAFGVKEAGEWVYEVLSGNHRTKAAIAAGLDEIWVMVTHDPLTEEQKIAIQLSHNAITGQDDPATLRKLYEQVGTVDLKVYCGLDDRTLELLEKVSPIAFSEAALEAKTLTMYFLPDELERAQTIIEGLLKQVSGDRTWLLRHAEYDSWLDLMAAAGGSKGVSNAATSLMVLLDVFSRHLDDLQEYLPARRDREYFPLAAVFGADRIPAATAKLLTAALSRLVDSGKAPNPLKALELLAKDAID